MSYWAKALQEFLDRKQMTPTEAAAEAKIFQSLVSRWLSGKQVVVSDNHWGLLCAGVVKDPLDRAELFRARLMDTCHGPGSELIEITISGKKKEAPKRSGLPDVQLPPRTERAMVKILERLPKEKALRDVVHSIAELQLK